MADDKGALRKGQWTPEEDKELVRLYSLKTKLAIKEIAYRLNQKFGDPPRNTGSTQQRLVKLRAEGVVAVREDAEGPGQISEDAEAYMAKLDAKKRKIGNGKIGKKTGTKAKDAAGIPRGRDVMLDSSIRVMEVDLGEKGSIRVEISGPILLNDALVTNVAEVISKAMVI